MLSDTNLPALDGFELCLRTAMRVELPGEAARYAPFQRLHNKQLLWYGVPYSELFGVLRDGVPTSDPLSPALGTAKGAVFSDLAGSAAKACAVDSANPHGVLLLVEVALGEVEQKRRLDRTIDSPAKHFHSLTGERLTIRCL